MLRGVSGFSLLALLWAGLLQAQPLTVTTVDSTDDVGEYTAIALNSQGHALIAYRDFNNSDLKLAVCNDTGCSQPQIRAFGITGVGGEIDLALTANDHPVISYRGNGGPLALTVCADPACANFITRQVADTFDVEFHTSLVLNGDGHPVVAFHQGDNARPGSPGRR
jgi:hypothetical protein